MYPCLPPPIAPSSLSLENISPVQQAWRADLHCFQATLGVGQTARRKDTLVRALARLEGRPAPFSTRSAAPALRCS